LSLSALALLIFGLGAVAWLAARAKASSFAGGGGPRLHSLPSFHGWYVALWAVLPALLFLTVWSSVSGNLVEQAVLESPAAARLPAFEMQRNGILNEARELAHGSRQAAFNPEATALAPIYQEASRHYGLIGAGAALLLAFAGGAFAYTRVSPSFRARTRVERLVMALLLLASLIAILTTLGIVLSLVFESFRFSRWSRRSNSCSA
jgi:phosphate transport system permease protein